MKRTYILYISYMVDSKKEQIHCLSNTNTASIKIKETNILFSMNSLFRHRRFSGADENNMALKHHLNHIRGKINMENTLYFFV